MTKLIKPEMDFFSDWLFIIGEILLLLERQYLMMWRYWTTNGEFAHS
jgi:hypothetical protein